MLKKKHVFFENRIDGYDEHTCWQRIYHYDIPLTISHETEALIKSDFSHIEVLKNLELTFTLKAYK